MIIVGYKPYVVDQELWYKSEVRPQNGHEYDAYILLYVDNVVFIHHDGEGIFHKIDKYLPIKDGFSGDDWSQTA